MDVLSRIDFSELVEDDEFTWHQFHAKVWGARDFERHAQMAMHNATGRSVPLTWILLGSQSMFDLIANPKILLNIRKMWDRDAIQVHCNSRTKILNRVDDLPGYRTVWYEPTGIANIISMSWATKQFWVVFDREGRNF